MSRIGKLPIQLPEGVKVEWDESAVHVEGPKGSLHANIPQGITLNLDEQNLVVNRLDESKSQRAYHGLTRVLINNMVIGLTQGFKKTLKIVGVGFTAELTPKNKNLLLKLGYTHSILFKPPEGIEIEVPNNTTIVISGIDKQMVGEVAAVIRSFRKPEPYKGKGIRYENERVVLKVGKAGKAG